MNHHSSTTKKYYPSLIGAALLSASLFSYSLPVFAAGTAAGTTLRNTATGNYQDDAGNEYTIESNTVEVTVAKVAGITNQPAGFDDLTPGNNGLLTGDRVYFDFEITNVGNDISNIYIPTLGNIATKGLNRDTDNVNDIDNIVLQVSPALNADGTVAADNSTFAFTDVPATGKLADDTATAQERPTNGEVVNVPVNGKVLVRVSSTVSATAAGALIEVLMGDTPPNSDPNAPVAATQNQPDDATDNQDEDVRTLRPAAGVGSDAAFEGGEKEASALQQQVLGSIPLAMARIEKVRGTVTNTSGNLTDNVIPYKLDLEVQNTTPNSLYTPGDLEGRDYEGRITGIANDSDPANTNDDDDNLILVSDAIPAGTVLTGAPTVPNANWTPVYSTETDTTLNPYEIAWSTTAPTNDTQLAAVKRVGWVYDARATGGNGPIEAGTTITSVLADPDATDPDTGDPAPITASGFTFEVETDNLTGNSGSVANIAQIFGGTVNGDDIFDESGDQDPSNFNGTAQGPNEDDDLSTGIANPNTHGIDADNNNTATGSPGGEDNVITFGAPGTLINGPQGQAGAIGNIFDADPADNQHDFQNLGISTNEAGTDVTATPGGDFDPGAVTFNNTFVYPDPDPTTSTEPLTNVRLQPVAPDFVNLGGVRTDLPNGTQVDIVLGGNTASYLYDATNGVFNIQGSPTTAITIDSLNPDTPLNYDVVVNLPGGTEFSTDLNRGFPVPIIVFSDSDNDGTPDIDEGTDPGTADDTFTNGNVTVNQVYTGFMKIVKQVRVIDGDTITGSDPDTGTTRNNMDFGDPASGKTPLPGDILEYRVIYRNITEPQAGDGTNGILNGVEFSLEENGTNEGLNGGTNNWGLDKNEDGDLDTVHIQNSAENVDNNGADAGGTIEFFTGGPGATLGDLTASGTTDPGDTVTGYRFLNGAGNPIPPAGAEATVANPEAETVDAGDFVFRFFRTVDDFDGLPEEDLD